MEDEEFSRAETWVAIGNRIPYLDSKTIQKQDLKQGFQVCVKTVFSPKFQKRILERTDSSHKDLVYLNATLNFSGGGPFHFLLSQ